MTGSGETIYGNASAAGTVSVNPPGTVTGTITNTAAAFTYTPVAACGPPYSSGAGIVGGSYNSSTGALTSGSHEVVAFAPGTYCLSSINLGSHSILTVTGATTINLTADSDFSSGDAVNGTGSPTNLTINSSAIGDKLKFNSGSTIRAALNCPGCIVTVSGSGSFYGAIIALTVSATGGASFHYDTQLGVGGSARMYSWVQTF